jgi:hypothetical protein
MQSSTLVSLAAAVIVAAPPAARALSLEEQVQVLAEEVRRLREQVAIPETDEELASWGGLGPAASKVYARTSGLALGGYGEFFFAAPTGGAGVARSADFFRFVTYVGYKFSDLVLMNTEIEFEHSTTSANIDGRAGSVSVEFAYLDFLIRDEVNARAGSLLLPMGLVNEMHEPPFYRGNFRPEVERTILPSTWRELGVGLHGTMGERVSYKAYLVNGLDAKGFDASGIRGGRQSGNRALWEDVAGVLALRVQAANPVAVGGSVLLGGADQSRLYDGRTIDATTRIAEGHLEVRHRGFSGRALLAGSSIEEAAVISADPDVDAVVPETQLGGYLEAAWDLAPVLGMPPSMSLEPWARWERLELQKTVPDGLAKDESRNGDFVTFGLEWKPDPSVVVKADLTLQRPDTGGSTEDPLRVGAGFIF